MGCVINSAVLCVIVTIPSWGWGGGNIVWLVSTILGTMLWPDRFLTVSLSDGFNRWIVWSFDIYDTQWNRTLNGGQSTRFWFLVRGNDFMRHFYLHLILKMRKISLDSLEHGSADTIGKNWEKCKKAMKPNFHLFKLIYCRIWYSNWVGSHALTTLVTTLSLV